MNKDYSKLADEIVTVQKKELCKNCKALFLLNQRIS